jgi:hypothetical protein
MLLAPSALLSPALTLAAPVGMSTSAQVATAEAAEAKIFTAAGRRRRGRRTARSSSTRRRPGAPPARRRSRSVRAVGAAEFTKLAIFRGDFDSQKDALTMLGAQMQSTLISYKVGRSAA